MLTMDQQNNNGIYVIDIPRDNQNNPNFGNNQLIVNNLLTSNSNPGSKKNSMVSLVGELTSSFSEQRSKIKNNVTVSSVLLGGGMISYAIGCAYDIVPLTVLGLIQLTGSAVVGNFKISHQATKYQFKNDRICDDLMETINSLPDIENQLKDTK